MNEPNPTMARQIARAASDFERRTTGHVPKSITVVLSHDTLVITLQGALSPAEKALASTSAGIAQLREFHRQLFATAGVSAEKGDMILERTAKGQTVFAQLLYAPRLTAQSAHAAPTQSRYTCDGAMKWYLLPAQAMPRVSLMTGHLRTSPMTGCWGAGVTFIPFGAPVA